MIGHRPSGRMCHGCEHRERDCSRLDFASMPVIKADKDGTQVVKCSQYVRAEPKNVPPIRWASAPEGAEYFSLHNWCFYRGERPNLEVYIHGWHPTMLPEEFDKHLVRRPVTVAAGGQ